MAYFPYAPAFGDTYWLVGPTGATARFNGETDDPEWSGVLTDVSGLDSTDVRESAEDLAESDGGVHGNFWLGRRPIVLNGMTYGHNSMAARAVMLDRINRASQAFRGNSELHWRPNGTVGNAIGNPYFATATTGWVAASGSNYLGTSAAGFAQGSGDSAGLSTDAGAAISTYNVVTSGGGSTNQGAEYAMTGGSIFKQWMPYTFSIYARSISGTTAANIYLGTTADGNSAAVTLTTSWKRFSVLWVPSTTTLTSVYAGIRIPAAAAATFRITGAQVNRGRYLSAWEDGTTPEMMTWVRRQQALRFTDAWNKTFQVPLVSQYARLYSAAINTHAPIAVGAHAGTLQENRGSYSSLPTLRLQGALGNGTTDTIQVFNNYNNKNVRFITGKTIVSTSYVDIDVASHTATEYATATGNWIADRTGDLDFINSTWPTVDSGTNDFYIVSGITGAGTLQTIWRDTWV